MKKVMAGIDQYSGIKHADDKNDAFFLAELCHRLRLRSDLASGAGFVATADEFGASTHGADAQFQKPFCAHDRPADDVESIEEYVGRRGERTLRASGQSIDCAGAKATDGEFDPEHRAD